MNCPLPDQIIEKALNASDLHIEEIRNGFSKQVYKINTPSENYMLYVWLQPYEGKLTENQTIGMEYLFPDGFSYFTGNTKLLTDIDVRVPQLISLGHYEYGNFDYAIVEFFKGISIDDYLKNSGDISLYAYKIEAVMSKMSHKKRGYYGSPIEIKPNNISAVRLAYNIYAEELNIASKIDFEVNALKSQILNLLNRKMNEIEEVETNEYSLIHGELTPDHIFILENDEIGLIDIEGVKYFDLEYDFAVIDLMYGGKIPLPNGINFKKLEFYKICLKISYVSAAADYLANVDSENEFFKSIYSSNIRDLNNLIGAVHEP